MRLFVATSLFAVSSLSAQTPNPLMLVSTEWLGQRINDPRIVVLHVGHGNDYDEGHIPRARAIEYRDVTVERDGVDTELPPVDQLRQTFEKLGISDDSHVVIYAHDGRMAPMASRVWLSLDYLGHEKISLLNGGIAKWKAEGRPISKDAPSITRGRLTPKTRTVTVDADWVRSRIGQKGVAFVDTRTTPEYLGTGERSGLPSTGHIAGARQLEWEQLFRDLPSGTFLDLDELSKLFAQRAAKSDTVVTYCLVGYRASMTYFGARLLGYPTRMYDGSYQDWARKGLPTKKGSAP
jgi:thiosulfate/3-mercaptopyruvate sulfurtransferase